MCLFVVLLSCIAFDINKVYKRHYGNTLFPFRKTSHVDSYNYKWMVTIEVEIKDYIDYIECVLSIIPRGARKCKSEQHYPSANCALKYHQTDATDSSTPFQSHQLFLQP